MTKRLPTYQLWRDTIPRVTKCPRGPRWVSKYHGCPVCTPGVLGGVLRAMPTVKGRP